MNINKLFPILKDENGKSIKCACPGCRRMARHIHHVQPRCMGGDNGAENLFSMCQKCHVAEHSANGDFSKWGKQGGKVTAEKMVSIPNLKQFQGTAGHLRWIEFCSRKANAKMGRKTFTAAEARAAFLPGGPYYRPQDLEDEASCVES